MTRSVLHRTEHPFVCIRRMRENESLHGAVDATVPAYRFWRTKVLAALWLTLVLSGAAPCAGQEAPAPSTPVPNQSVSPPQVQPFSDALPLPTSAVELTQRFLKADTARAASALRTVGWFAMIGILPTLALLSTSFIRTSIVLGMLRQALGAQWILSPQILTPLSLMLACGIMGPTWKATIEAINTAGGIDQLLTQSDNWASTTMPLREFMSQQIEQAGNGQDVWLFLEYSESPGIEPASYEDVPLDALFPAFILSELKTGFLIAFQIYLPFLAIDMILSLLTTVAGLSSLPLSTISLPLKLFVFGMADGWHLVIETLLRSFVVGG
jgi:flagellar biosynthesis protein FliP